MENVVSREKHTDTFQALRNDIFELTAAMKAGFERMDQRFSDMQTQMDNRFSAMDQRFEDLQTQMDRRFSAVDKKFTMMFVFMTLGFTIMATLMTVYQLV